MTHFVYTGVVVGVDGQRVCVEASLRPGIPYFDLVGLAGTALKEARIRVEQAVRASGYSWTRKRIVLNLAPADLRKEGGRSTWRSPSRVWPRASRSTRAGSTKASAWASSRSMDGFSPCVACSLFWSELKSPAPDTLWSQLRTPGRRV